MPTKKEPQKKRSTKANPPKRRTRSSRANTPKKSDALRGRMKPEEFRQYGLFMALPGEERMEIFGFKTDKEFAKKFDVNPATLSEWKWDQNLWDIRDEYLVVFKKHTSEIIASLAKRAKRSGEAFHALTWLKVVEGFTEKQGIDITSKNQRVAGFEVTIRNADHQPKITRNKPQG